MHILWIVGVGLVIAGLLVNETTGNVLYQMLVANGVLAFMAYLAFRGFLTENPKFLAAHTRLVISLWIMTIGALGISLSTLLELFSIFIPASSPLFWGGGIAFLASSCAFILSLVVAKPKPISPS